jgi:hypothetical protein
MAASPRATKFSEECFAFFWVHLFCQLITMSKTVESFMGLTVFDLEV